MAANFGHAGAKEPLIISSPKRYLVVRRKSDPDKLEIAAGLRRESTLMIKALAAIVHLGRSVGKASPLSSIAGGKPMIPLVMGPNFSYR